MKGLSAVVARDVDGAMVLNEAMNEVCSIVEGFSLGGGCGVMCQCTYLVLLFPPLSRVLLVCHLLSCNLFADLLRSWSASVSHV